MKDLLRRFRILLLAVVLAMLALQLLGSRLDKHAELSALDRVLLAAYRPVNAVITWPFAKLADVWSHYLALVGTRQENERLEQLNSELRMRLDELSEQERANARYQRLLGFRDVYPGELLPAGVIARSVVGEHRTIVIDRGAADGLEPGLAVLSPDGLAGYVTSVAGRVAVVTLIIDQRSAVDAIDQRSRARGLIQGASRDRLAFAFLEQSLDVAVDDRVVTSGLGTRTVVPKGLLIGAVVHVEQAPDGLTQSVEVRPAVDFSSLEEVFVQLPSDHVIDLTDVPGLDVEPFDVQAAPPAELPPPVPAQPAAPQPTPEPAHPADAGTGGVP